MLIGLLIGGVLALIGMHFTTYEIDPYLRAKEELIRKGEISQNNTLNKKEEQEKEIKINQLVEKYKKISNYGGYLLYGSIPLTIILINVLK